MSQHVITIFGGGDCGEGDPLFAAAEQLGAECARRGWSIANGGYGGTMLAAARGSSRAGGRAIGVTCRFFRAAANPFISEAIATPTLHDRIRKLVELGDGYVVLPGATGTLAELAIAWELVNKRIIPERPIVCLGDYWRPVVDLISNASRRDKRIPGLEHEPGGVGELVAFADDAAGVMKKLDEKLGG
ncbi:MAG: LOG family protein [Candidatus Sumerlaeia bacterium]